jgi:hypothetical protein
LNVFFLNQRSLFSLSYSFSFSFLRIRKVI